MAWAFPLPRRHSVSRLAASDPTTALCSTAVTAGRSSRTSPSPMGSGGCATLAAPTASMPPIPGLNALIPGLGNSGEPAEQQLGSASWVLPGIPRKMARPRFAAASACSTRMPSGTTCCLMARFASLPARSCRSSGPAAAPGAPVTVLQTASGPINIPGSALADGSVRPRGCYQLSTDRYCPAVNPRIAAAYVAGSPLNLQAPNPSYVQPGLPAAPPVAPAPFAAAAWPCSIPTTNRLARCR